ncbi:MAG: hypothetical protein ABI587_06850 [Gemmatimonadales bacterium]
MEHHAFRRLSLLATLTLPGVLVAQGAVDPSIAPRAAVLIRAGAPVEATEMLGRYLATAPDDGAAWLQLGIVYLLDSRDWHRSAHIGDPPGDLFLDFAATAFDQSLRLPTDSSVYLRAMVELERAISRVEDAGWPSLRMADPDGPVSQPPRYVSEAGRNLVNSCPARGVLVTGSELEAVGVWSALVVQHLRADLVLFLPVRYAEDSLYRQRMAEELKVTSELPVRTALARVAEQRPVCYSPMSDSTLTPRTGVRAMRLARVTGADDTMLPSALGIADLLQATASRPAALSREVVGLYLKAARANHELCGSLLAPLGAQQRDACGR